MNLRHKQKGFSLTEVLLAVATLAIGMTFIGGTFLVAVHLSTVSTERTIAAAAADEAFAKIQLYGLDPVSPVLLSNKQVRYEDLNTIPAYEYAYPSTQTVSDKQYYWAAVCRSVYPDGISRIIQVTVFVSRKVGNRPYPGGSEIPVPVKVAVSTVIGNENMLTINLPEEQSFFNPGGMIVADGTGRLYKVLKRDAVAPNTIVLDKSWEEPTTDFVWVVPPPEGGGKHPCISVYQKEIRF